MKVHEQDAAAAPHQPPRRDGGVDAARQQARHAAADADRHAARAAFLAEVVERLVRQRLDVDRELRLVEVDEPASRFLDPAADLAFDLRRGQREPLVGPAGARPGTCARSRVAEIVQDRRRDRVDVERRAPRLREVGHAEHARRCGRGRPCQSAASPSTTSIRPMSTRTSRHADVRRRLAQVARQPRDEPGAVVAFEGDFLVVDDDGFHELDDR